MKSLFVIPVSYPRSVLPCLKILGETAFMGYVGTDGNPNPREGSTVIGTGRFVHEIQSSAGLITFTYVNEISESFVEVALPGKQIPYRLNREIQTGDGLSVLLIEINEKNQVLLSLKPIQEVDPWVRFCVLTRVFEVNYLGDGEGDIQRNREANFNFSPSQITPSCSRAYYWRASGASQRLIRLVVNSLDFVDDPTRRSGLGAALLFSNNWLSCPQERRVSLFASLFELAGKTDNKSRISKLKTALASLFSSENGLERALEVAPLGQRISLKDFLYTPLARLYDSVGALYFVWQIACLYDEAEFRNAMIEAWCSPWQRKLIAILQDNDLCINPARLLQFLWGDYYFIAVQRKRGKSTSSEPVVDIFYLDKVKVDEQGIKGRNLLLAALGVQAERETSSALPHPSVLPQGFMEIIPERTAQPRVLSKNMLLQIPIAFSELELSILRPGALEEKTGGVFVGGQFIGTIGNHHMEDLSDDVINVYQVGGGEFFHLTTDGALIFNPDVIREDFFQGTPISFLVLENRDGSCSLIFSTPQMREKWEGQFVVITASESGGAHPRVFLQARPPRD